MFYHNRMEASTSNYKDNKLTKEARGRLMWHSNDVPDSNGGQSYTLREGTAETPAGCSHQDR